MRLASNPNTDLIYVTSTDGGIIHLHMEVRIYVLISHNHFLSKNYKYCLLKKDVHLKVNILFKKWRNHSTKSE
jgi:hypothetical protein